MVRIPFEGEIIRAARDWDLDPDLVKAVVMQESSGRADAFRHEPEFWKRYCEGNPRWEGWEPRRVASSYGLMQVMYPTAIASGFRGEPEELFQIRVNLQVGCRVLAELLHWAKGAEAVALAAYNGGKGGIAREAPQAYARQVLARKRNITGSNVPPSSAPVSSLPGGEV